MPTTSIAGPKARARLAGASGTDDPDDIDPNGDTGADDEAPAPDDDEPDVDDGRAQN